MGKTLNISDEERALLTDEEIAGMEEGEDFDEGQEEGEDDTTAAAAAAPADDAAAQPAAQAEADAAAAAAAADKPADDANDKPAGEAEQGTPTRETGKSVNFQPELPADYDDQVTRIANEKKTLFEQFDEGDISNAEYASKLDELGKQERELERLRDRVEDATRSRYETWVNVHVGGFLAQHPEYQTNPMLMGVLDNEVKRLQSQAEIDTDPQILIDAHAAISKSFPGVFGEAKPAPAAQQEAKKPTPPAAKPTVPTLANVPAANIDQPGEGKFSYLDRLSETDPLRFEAELAKLSPADQNEYLAS